MGGTVLYQSIFKLRGKGWGMKGRAVVGRSVMTVPCFVHGALVYITIKYFIINYVFKFIHFTYLCRQYISFQFSLKIGLIF